MKFVESYSKKDFDKETKQVSYNKIGKIIRSNEKVFAKFLEIDVNNSIQSKFFIATHNNVPYDPNGIDSHRESDINIQLKSVSKEVFNYYILYLQTKNSLYMTRTQRSYINV
jgi:hypothetical protein